MKYHNKLWLPLLCFIALTANSQLVPLTLDCPPNIGFESGSFNNWNCFAGAILRDGTLNLSPSSPVADRHTIIANSFPQSLDPYGGFPVNCPNGSGYSVRLGNSSAGGQAESISYTLTIPANQSDYSILYNYAVVFQNPAHRSYEQPRFTSKVYNVTDNKYISCGSFEFVASSNLPGFKLSNSGSNVFYKPWSPVTVNLSGLAGKTVRLEFSTNDCAFTQHFGYAYLDVNEDCSSGPISGNTYCAGAESLILTAPFGFASYSWYTADFSQLLGNENVLNIKPAPAANTTYGVVIIPYDGLGCLDTLYTTIHASNEPFKMNVLNEITGCSSGVDLTSPTITAGSTPGLNYTYFTDLSQTDYVSVPSKVTTSGIYYIKGINKTGCNDIKPINVIISEPPNLMVNNPAGVCIPQKIDITNPSITAGSEQGLKISYWKNISGTVPLLNPNAIDVGGLYYIKAEKNGFCDILKPVEVKIGPVPTFIIRNVSACGKTDISEEAITAGSSPNLAYTYWMDTLSTMPLPNPQNITASGTYYIKATSILGCSVIKPISVTINPFPDFTVTDPKPVVYPQRTIDLTSAVNQNIGLTYTYWLDSLTRRPVANPRAVDKRGRYFIKATNIYGCSVVQAVNAIIIPPPAPIIYAPTAFTPNNDGLNDVFRIKIIGETSVNQLKIYNRWGQVIYDDPDLTRNWNGKLKEIELPVGVYIWILEGFDTYFKKSFAQKGLITIVR